MVEKGSVEGDIILTDNIINYNYYLLNLHDYNIKYNNYMNTLIKMKYNI